MSALSDVVIVDTSVLLNFLNVPGFNDDRAEVEEQFGEYVRADASLLLPIATVLETGNHISKLSDGGRRRQHAEEFCRQVRKALSGEAPWSMVRSPGPKELDSWLAGFPDRASQKMSLADVSLVDVWNSHCRRHPHARIRIWSTDGDLSSYDRAQ